MSLIKLTDADKLLRTPARLAIALVAVGILLAANSAQANYSCSGPVSYLAVNSGDYVYVAVGSFGVWAICHLSGPSQGVSVDACKAWYAGLLAAKRSESNVTMYFEGSAGGNNGPACAALGNWTTPTSYHIDF